MINFTCTCTASIIYFITNTCKKLHMNERGRRLGDRFRVHLHDVVGNDKDKSKPVAKHLISLIIPCTIWQFRPFSASKQFRKPQNSGTKLSLSNRHPSSPQYQRALFIQPMKSAFKLFIEVNLRHELSCQYQTSLLYSPTDAAPQF